MNKEPFKTGIFKISKQVNKLINNTKDPYLWRELSGIHALLLDSIVDKDIDLINCNHNIDNNTTMELINTERCGYKFKVKYECKICNHTEERIEDPIYWILKVDGGN